ncbi:MAG: hypothetical protein R2729_14555 [Bryobacteraceae bacterium]
MAVTADHLRADLRVTLLRDYEGPDGVRIPAGAAGTIRHLTMDWKTLVLTVEWERGEPPGREAMRFLASTRMRDFFSEGEPEPPSRPIPVTSSGFVLRSAEPRPPAAKRVFPAAGQEVAASDNVWALAAAGRWDEAQAQVGEVLKLGDRASWLAGELGLAAVAHCAQPGPVYAWLRDAATRLWYHWGAQATSGGDGAARSLEIDPAVRRFKEIDAARKKAGIAD